MKSRALAKDEQLGYLKRLSLFREAVILHNKYHIPSICPHLAYETASYLAQSVGDFGCRQYFAYHAHEESRIRYGEDHPFTTKLAQENVQVNGNGQPPALTDDKLKTWLWCHE